MLVIAHEGGPIKRRRRMHDGGLASDEVPLIAQEGEIMIRRDVAQRPGMADFLLGLNAGEFHRGGPVRRMHEAGEVIPSTGGWYWIVNQDGQLVPVQGDPNALQQWSPSQIPGFWDTGAGSLGGGQVWSPSQIPGFWGEDTSGGGGGGSKGGGGKPPWTQTPPGSGPLSAADQARVAEKFGGGAYAEAIAMGEAMSVAATGGVPWGGSGTPRGGSFFHSFAGSPLPGSFAGLGSFAQGFLPQSWQMWVGTRSPAFRAAKAAGKIVNPAALAGGYGGLWGGGAGGSRHTPMKLTQHVGGLIRRMHSGGSVGNIAKGAGSGGAGQIHIYNFTDQRAMVRHMASRSGRKIIVDTVQGKRIDLGFGK
jgi:hypothetical protein